MFTGGTALSKAHGLIQRFSEDIDFRIITPCLAQKSRSEQKRLLSTFKHVVIVELKTVFLMNEAHIMARNENHFFSIEINYHIF
ncbi:nucleotidyl transferase AbiEii/AbiGii toxin family protein [Chitinophaga sp. YR573]|uniref:nucleotidyl transferase AbiEii/AbiGii toxin family protein n=1 Tax=Chitinophaga sp. YR573 TaxID=1881040 RepID=UPI003977D179